jgi:Bifunctional DNA primase/polymerase, N-terminal/Protein of unknown function (DUF3987)
MTTRPSVTTPIDAAREYLARGWYPVPIPPGLKRAVLKDWPSLRLQEADLPKYFKADSNIGLILGEPSGWLVDVDLDCEEAIELADQYLPSTAAITGRPGAPRSHRWYIAKDAKTAKHTDPNTKKMIVELRSTGTQTVVGPSIHPDDHDRYDVLTGEPAEVPVAMLSVCVAALATAVEERRYGAATTPQKNVALDVEPRAYSTDLDVEARAIAYLDKMSPAISGQAGHNATYTAATALVHGFGIPPERALAILLNHYNPRCEPPWNNKELQHKVKEAANKPHSRPFCWLRDAERERPMPEEHLDVDLSKMLAMSNESDEREVTTVDDPGPVPDTLLRVPGFINEVMDYCIENAPTRNPAMAFCGALALQSFLGGRKVRDAADNRTNLYLLALAPTGSGKDYPRKINKIVLSHIGLGRASVLRFASGEAIEDKLAETPCLLCQTDEIDGLLLQIKSSRDGRYESLMDRLKEIYTSADQSVMTRCLAKTQSVEVHQPSLTLLGSATPTHYYSALSEKMLTDGFFSRTICIEAIASVEDQDPKIVELPQRILETATWWSRFSPTLGNIANHNPTPAIVPMTDGAQSLIREVRTLARQEQDLAMANNRAIDSAIWSRVRQMTHKLALVYAISQNHQVPRIDVDAVTWARDFTLHQAKRMLFMAQGYVSNNEFDADCKKALRILTDWQDKHGSEAVIVPWRFRQRMSLHPQKFKDVVFELEQRRQIQFVTIPGKTKPSSGYQLK